MEMNVNPGISESKEDGVPERKTSGIWVWLAFIAAWFVGTAGIATGISTGILPTYDRIEGLELLLGSVCYGFLFALVVALILHSFVRRWARQA